VKRGAQLPAGMCVNQDGYLRVHRAGPMRDKYAHRLYADRQMMESHGRHLSAHETVHHLCQNKLCWPPTDFHLVIMDWPLHAAIDAGITPHIKWWLRQKKKKRGS
jgi:hypothetical protein